MLATLAVASLLTGLALVIPVMITAGIVAAVGLLLHDVW